MKKLYSKPISLFKYAITISTAFVLIASIVALFFGFNKSVYFGDSYELRVRIMNEEDYDSYLEKTAELFEKKGLSIREVKKGTTSYDYSLLVRFKSSEKVNTEDLANDLATALGVDSNIINVNYVAKTNLDGIWSNILIIFVLAELLLVLYGFIRKNMLLAQTLGLTFLFEILLSFAFISVARIELSIPSIGLVSTLALISVLAVSCIINDANQLVERKHEGKMSSADAVCLALNQGKIKALIVGIVFVAIFGAFAISGNILLLNLALAGFVALFASALTVLLVALPFFLAVSEHKENKIKNVMSRNNLDENQKKIDKTNK